MLKRLLSFFLILISPKLLFAQSFEQALRYQVQKATQHRDGVVVWFNLEKATSLIAGNQELLSRPFRPGSLFKLITAEALLKNFPKRHFTCEGQWKGHVLQRCWTHRGHGHLNLAQALGVSCNLFFGSAGEWLGLDKILSALKNYSDLPQPNSSEQEEVKKELFHFSIGDSPLYKVTPLQILEFWKKYLKQLAKPEYSPIAQGLKRSVSEGTARRSRLKSLEFFAKTGTSDDERGRTDAWYLAAVPAENPRFALLIFLRNAYGFRESSELAKNIFLEVIRRGERVRE